jgi:hypothetical protein
MQVSYDIESGSGVAGKLRISASGAGNFFQFTFSPLAAGTGNLTLANIMLVDSVGNPISYTFADAQVTVTQPVATPEPGTLFLLLSAIIVTLLFTPLKRA